MAPFGAQFNYPAWNMIHGDSLSTMIPQFMEQSAARSLMYTMPSTDCGIFASGGYDNSKWFELAALGNQTIFNYMQNNQGGFFNINADQFWRNGGVGGFGIGGFNPWGATTPSGSGSSGSSSSSSSSSGTKEETELKKLKELYTQLSKMDGAITDDIKKAYNDAINGKVEETDTNGKVNKRNKTNQEKIDDLKDVLKRIDKDNFVKLVIEDKSVQGAISLTGYKFDSNVKLDKDIETQDKAISAEIETVYNELKAGTKVPDKLGILAGNVKTDNAKLLKYISKWNDKYNSDNQRSLMMAIANHIPNSNSEKAGWHGVINNLAQALVNEAGVIDDKYPGLKKAKEAVNAELETINKDSQNYTTLTRANVKKLAAKFEELYAILRIVKAKETDKEINKIINDKYGDINQFAEGAIPTDMVEKGTRKDLANEKVTIPADSTVAQSSESNDSGNSSGANNDGNSGNSSGAGNSGNSNGSQKTENTVTEGSGSMTELAEEKELKTTGLIGFYKDKEGNIYEFVPSDGYNKSDGSFKLRSDISAIDGAGRAKIDGKWKYIREVESAEEAGKALWDLLGGDTTSDEYADVIRKINSFASYENDNEIVEFIEAYNDAMGTPVWNNMICSQISTESNYGKENKVKALQIIAKQIMKIMEKHPELGFGMSSEAYRDMKYYAEKTNENDDSWRKDANMFLGINWFGKGWSFTGSPRTGAANHMDDIIKDVIQKYRAKNPKSDSASETVSGSEI